MDLIKSHVKNLYRNAERKYLEKRDFFYKEQICFEKRHEESKKILVKYPNRVPIIVERFGNNVPEIDRKKYLVPEDLSLLNFIYVLRKRLKIDETVALFIFINEKILLGSDLLGNIYEKNRDDDGFLYIKYTGENTFG